MGLCGTQIPDRIGSSLGRPDIEVSADGVKYCSSHGTGRISKKTLQMWIEYENSPLNCPDNHSEWPQMNVRVQMTTYSDLTLDTFQIMP